jgi:hypothetical protein
MAARKFSVGTVTDFVHVVKRCVMAWGGKGPIWYRGQSQANWPLVPKLLRVEKPDERALRIDFRRLGMELLAGRIPPANHWEWYFLAQHFGLPTRLLDWTENALFALYFAVRDSANRKGQTAAAVVWVLDPKWLNLWSINKGHIVLPGEEFLRWLPEDPRDYPNPDQYPEFKEKWESKPIAIAPPHVDRRLAVQRSQFVLFGMDSSALVAAESEPNAKLVKIEIVGESTGTVLNDLHLLGFFEATLFPDLEGLSRELTLKYAPLQ